MTRNLHITHSFVQDRHTGLALSFIIIAAAATPATAKEICWTEGPSQFADATHFCVSSVLPPQGRSSYGPKNLVDYFGSTGAWCEGASGHGVGQTITVRIDRGPAFRRLVIKNGYGKSAKSFADNGRLKTVRITSDTGINTTLDLIDQAGEQPIYLPLIAPHRWVKLEILDVYPGARFADTCVSAVGPDFVYEEELLQSQQATKTGPAEPAIPPARQAETLPAETVSRGGNKLGGDKTGQQPVSTDCLKAGAPVTGKLEIFEAEHPAGHDMKSFHIVLPAPVCVVDLDNDKLSPVLRIQLAPGTDEDRGRLSDSVGMSVTVSGDFAPPHTAWHTGDAVLVDMSIVETAEEPQAQHQPEAAEPTGVQQPDRISDELFWNTVKDSKDAELYRLYLDQFPSGVFAEEARKRVAQFDKATKVGPGSKISAVHPAYAQSLSTTEVTIGGCDAICQETVFCKDFDYDLKTFTCTIFFKSADPEYLRLRKTCPQVRPENLKVSHFDGKWVIRCLP